MKSEHRYVVAFIAASLGSKTAFTHVHDHDAGVEIPFGGLVRSDKVDVVEGGARARISGAPAQLFHDGSQAYINLAVEGDSLSGYDYASEHHFAGRVTGSAVQIFDHETGRYHDFHVS
ncbi:MAG TPA: hypothetical protein VG960_14040 [Caulobacteraceae bacterium]|nr:hypothetical protein [Caulobacteraceae bacterium]